MKREVLIAAAQDREVDMLLVTIAPGAGTEPERAHYGDECGIVLMGKIIINLGKEAYSRPGRRCILLHGKQETLS